MVDFLALCCGACRMFQVQQEKKAKKWTCVVCGAKQTLQKVYARGSSRDMRGVVQDLNMKRGVQEAEGVCADADPLPPGVTGMRGLDVAKGEPEEGGWGSYLDEGDSESDKDTDVVADPADTDDFISAFKRASSRRGSGAGSAGRKRGYAALEADVASALEGPGESTAWKRQRLATCTPRHSPNSTPSERSRGGACDAVAHGREEQLSRMPRWHVGLQPRPRPQSEVSGDPLDALADLALGTQREVQPDVVDVPEQEPVDADNVWSDFV